MMLDIDALPQPSEAFVWVQAPDGPALVCRPLSALTAHLFTTRHWALGARGEGSGDERAWAEVARAIDVGPGHLVRTRQVHGTSVHVARAHSESRPEADIVLAFDAGVGAAVQAADCVPLLVVDERLGAVAAAHAGWRGLAARVPAAVVSALNAERGSRPEDLFAAIGPAIGACCYQVGSEVLEAFVAQGQPPERLAQYFLSAPIHSDRNPSLPGLTGAPRVDRWFFDMWRVTRDQLEAAGVPGSRIFTAELCTASHPTVLCSYRRDGSPAGRIAGAITPVRRGP
jgi:YfiH family protein